MKLSSTFKNLSLVLLAITVIMACQDPSKTSEETNTNEESNTTEELNSSEESNTVNYEMFLAWDSLRNNRSEVESVFGQGNYFTFTIPEESEIEKIHVYVGLTENQACFYLVDAVKDVKETYENPEFQWLASNCLSNEFGDLQDIDSLYGEENPYFIPLDTAKTRLADWTNSEKRNNWINNEDNDIPQLFIIHVDDVNFGVEHVAYFALNTDTNLPELIILNSKDLEPGSGVIHNLEDMTAPIPPFDPGKNGAEDFGLLDYLNI